MSKNKIITSKARGILSCMSIDDLYTHDAERRRALSPQIPPITLRMHVLQDQISEIPDNADDQEAMEKKEALKSEVRDYQIEENALKTLIDYYLRRDEKLRELESLDQRISDIKAGNAYDELRKQELQTIENKRELLLYDYSLWPFIDELNLPPRVFFILARTRTFSLLEILGCERKNV